LSHQDEPTDENSEDGRDNKDAEEIGGNEAVLKHTSKALKKMRKLHTMLHDRHVVLVLALRFGWRAGDEAERLLLTCDAMTVFERILRAEEEGKRKKRDAEEPPTKRRNVADNPKKDGSGQASLKGSGSPSWDMLSQLTQAAATAAAAAARGPGPGQGGYHSEPQDSKQFGPPSSGRQQHGYGGQGAGPSGQRKPYTPPEEMKCFNCNQAGHNAKWCRNPPAQK
jgi:hypothetical protein